MSKPKSTLVLLAETILAATSRTENQLDAAGLAFPSLNDPFDPFDPTTPLLFHPDVAGNAALIYGAAEQLLASIRPPPLVVM